MKRGLYIHIPFCDYVCNYCDFPKRIGNKKMIDEYIMLALRSGGINLEVVKEKFSSNWYIKNSEKINKSVSLNILKVID